MIQYEDFLETLLDNTKKLFSPAEWVTLDLSLSKTEIFCLLWMSRNHEVIMSQIAEMLDIPMSTATGVVNRLVKKGYLERYRSETDRRIVVIRLTGDGQKLVDEVKATASKYFQLFTEALTEEEKAALLQIMRKMLNHFGKKEMNTTEAPSSSGIKQIPIE
ncbi:MarR family transcriptional regulator [Bacillus sp. 165]|uniref:MarR family winged helix-turn-helix transcriptional regulator n=1 Tax=Bacillus sp. 165 TaxID=1529117 RepID=UPI001ADC860D|nr:MarR family transcriptional regulator [Bacillus sp. 165]